MRSRIRKWGNSLAIRIPKSIAEETSLSDDTAVDIKVVNGKIVVASVPQPELSMKTLLDGVDDRNRHRSARGRREEEP